MRARPGQYSFAAARRIRNRLALVATAATLVATGVVAVPARSDLRSDISDKIQALTQGRADRGRRVRLARGDLQLDQADNFLCHLHSPMQPERMGC